MDTISIDDTVSELVQAKPSRSRVFESLGINYCCAGDKTLREACTKKNLDSPAVLTLLQEADSVKEAPGGVNPSSMDLDELVGHIIETHHDYLRSELPRLETLLEKVARVHGDHEPRLREMYHVYGELSADFLRHLRKEEQILFPAIRQLANKDDAFPSGLSITQPIAQMETEHENTERAFAQLRELSDDFTPPEWACNTYRAAFDGLRDLVENTARHTEKEDRILFVRAIERENALRPDTGNEEAKDQPGYSIVPSLASHVTCPEEGILSKLVVSDAHIRVTMFGLSKGQEMTEHATNMEAVIQFVEGRATVTLGNDSHEVDAGTWIRMTPGLPHSILAQTPVKMLLIILRQSKPTEKK